MKYIRNEKKIGCGCNYICNNFLKYLINVVCMKFLLQQ